MSYGLFNLYLVKFHHIETGKEFYKVGYCASTVTERFDVYYQGGRYKNDRYRYPEFEITEVFSIKGSKPFVTEKEEILKQIFPKNFYPETYLGKPWNHYKRGMTGITEMVRMDESEVEKAINMMAGWEKYQKVGKK